MKYLGVVTLALGLACLAAAREADDLRFVGINSVYTNYNLATTTVTAYISCSSTLNDATACSVGRRRRRSVPIEMTSNDVVNAAELDSGMDTETRADGTSSDKSEKLLFTLWSTTNMDVGVTYTSTDTGTTVSISYACTVPSTDKTLQEAAC